MIEDHLSPTRQDNSSGCDTERYVPSLETRSAAAARRLMGMQLFTYRLASDRRLDTIRVSGKTGSDPHPRHEIGDVESVEGGARGGGRLR